MRGASTTVEEGDLIDTFSIPVSSPAPAGVQETIGTYNLATITIGYRLATIKNKICSSSLVIIA